MEGEKRPLDAMKIIQGEDRISMPSNCSKCDRRLY
jgi:hypothetical protein